MSKCYLIGRGIALILLLGIVPVLTDAPASGIAPARAAEEAISFGLESATLSINTDGTAQVFRADGSAAADALQAFGLRTQDGFSLVPSRIVKQADDRFDVVFSDNSTVSFETVTEPGFVLFKVVAAEFSSPVEVMTCFQVMIPQEASYAGQINQMVLPDGFSVALMTAAVNLRPIRASRNEMKGDHAKCSHTFKPLECQTAQSDRGLGKRCAEFCAESKRDDSLGWSVHGKYFPAPLDLTGCRAIRARIWSDGNGEHLKIQLGGKTGHRDDYIPANFTGWKTVTLTDPALNDLSYDDVRYLYFYYNSLPAGKSVRCLIDQVEAVFGEGDAERTVVLEDFEADNLSYWDNDRMQAVTYAKHQLFPTQFALIATDPEHWSDTVERMQHAANLPSPKPGGAWRDASRYVHQSYFFLTYFNVNEYDAALAFAKRGGFKQILLLQNSWCKTTGHFEVNEENFPGGLPTLRATIEKFRSEGIRFGLHFLAASIDPPDPYLTPVPDKRFVTGHTDTLTADLDKETTTVPLAGDAKQFPTGQDSYMGSGQVVRIDDELIQYGETGPDGLTQCTRGLYGTTVAEHKAGAQVAHFVRAYGYHMYDLDTDFPEEIAANFARVANELPLDMIYFDGSELLQRPEDHRDHWYYNARLHRAFYDAVNDKNILYQGSSCSPCSWHQLLRSASADGHDDLKAYLEERSGAFLSMARDHMPLDIGWYYGYDRNATPDMYEYVLGATIGYDSSMSFQASVGAAMAHPFIGEILDMIRTYEELRLSGKIPVEWREKFQIDSVMAGYKSEEERNALLGHRRDFHLETNADGKQQFRRVIYPLWQRPNAQTDAQTDAQPNSEGNSSTWTLTVDEPCRVGFQVHFLEEGTTEEGAKIAQPSMTITGENLSETITLDMELTRGQYGFALPGQKATRYGRPLTEPEVLTETPDIVLTPGTYTIEYKAAGTENLPVRVRTPLYTDECLVIP